MCDTMSGRWKNLITKPLWMCRFRHTGWLQSTKETKDIRNRIQHVRTTMAGKSNKRPKWGLDTSQKQFQTFSFCGRQSRFSEVGRRSTLRLFTAMTLRWDWSRDMTLKHHPSSQDRLNHTAQCIKGLLHGGVSSIYNAFQVHQGSRNSREKHFCDRFLIKIYMTISKTVINI